MAIAVQVRLKVLAALARGESAVSIAGRLEIGERSVYRLQARDRAGCPVEPAKTGPKGPIKLARADTQVLRAAVARTPGITALEVLPRLTVKVAPCTVCRAWKRLGLTRKKSR